MEAESAKTIPAVSARNDREIAGEISKSTISGYLPASTAGSIEKTKENLITEAKIVQNSRTFGLLAVITIRAAAKRETSIASNGFSEKYVSIGSYVKYYLSTTFIT